MHLVCVLSQLLVSVLSVAVPTNTEYSLYLILRKRNLCSITNKCCMGVYASNYQFNKIMSNAIV